MNRLVIVGNGFDLAHGLPTGYCDFINTYWNEILTEIKNQDPLKEMSYKNNLMSLSINFGYHYPMYVIEDFKKVNTYKGLIDFLNGLNSTFNHYSFLYSIEFKNDFFGKINSKYYIQNWVDIENEYYRLLKECLKEEDSVKVKNLNNEFEEVKNALGKYLTHEVLEKTYFDRPSKDIESLIRFFEIKPLHLKNDWNHPYLKEFPKDDHKALIEFDNIVVEAFKTNTLANALAHGHIYRDNLFLNFNYTNTLDAYIDVTNSHSFYDFYGTSQQIQIHGRLDDVNNRINFGFGDEMDDDYKVIEKKDDNEYLKNIKSFQYLQNSNYKNMLDFIENGKFQVYIMGHSCGLSDRILLNKIFEHHNCRSIKVFYHEFKEPKANGVTDNYTEIIQNISRHFNKKEMMREKIVNKSLCQPLPQGVRLKKKITAPYKEAVLLECQNLTIDSSTIQSHLLQ